MWSDSFVAFDTETTGVNGFARILELGIVYFEHGKPVDRWSTFFNPPDLDWLHPDVKEALAVNQITKEMCAGAPSFKEALPEILSRLEESVHVAHNLAFDRRMIQQEFGRIGFEWGFVPQFEICTMCTSHRIHPTERTHKLEATAERWGVKQEDAHRAEVDALTAGLIFAGMVQGGHLPIQEDDVVSFQKEAAAAWFRRPRR
jgi:DNA polymerase-3 subunit epsilon